MRQQIFGLLSGVWLITHVLADANRDGKHHPNKNWARDHIHHSEHRHRHHLDSRALGAEPPAQQGQPSAPQQSPPPKSSESPKIDAMASVQGQVAGSAPGSYGSPLHFDDDNDGDTPAGDVIEMLDELYGDSLGTGPSDDWRNLGQAQAQPVQNNQQQEAVEAPVRPPVSTQSEKTITVQETEVIWVTSTIHAAGILATSAPAPNPEAPAAPPPPPPPPPPSSTPPAVASSPPVVTVENPQPVPQQPAKAEEVQTIAKPQPTQQQQPETVAKPQPTQQQPAGSPSKASPVNTDGLPLDFVANLDCHSPVYQGLSKLHHDIHRTNHSLTPLAWNDTLFDYAKETAETCVYGHSLVAGGGGYGQNIAAGDAPGNISAVLTNMYYNAEIELFFEAIGRQWGSDQPDMTNFEKWGHATQMLWKTTTSFACYTATCSPPGADPLACKSDGTSYLKNVGCGNGGTPAYNTVCNYYPPGNYAGEYSSVPGPLGKLGFVEMTGNGVVGLQ